MKAVVKMPCTDGNCKHEHEMLVDTEELGVKMNEKVIPNGTVTRVPEMAVTSTINPTEPPKPKTIIESHIPGYRCPDGNCGQVHKNKNYNQRVKGKCTNCQQFTRTEKGPCPWCGNNEIDEISEEELDNLGIPTPIHIHEE